MWVIRRRVASRADLFFVVLLHAENKEVREAVYETMRWWLDKGVDGFRVSLSRRVEFEIRRVLLISRPSLSSQMDVINLISKTDGLPDGSYSICSTLQSRR